jgi:hypothetical protein
MVLRQFEVSSMRGTRLRGAVSQVRDRAPAVIDTGIAVFRKETAPVLPLHAQIRFETASE